MLTLRAGKPAPLQQLPFSSPPSAAPLQQLPLPPSPHFPPRPHTPIYHFVTHTRACANFFPIFPCHILPYFATFCQSVELCSKKIWNFVHKALHLHPDSAAGPRLYRHQPSRPDGVPTNDSSPLTPTTHRKARCSLVVHFRGKAAPTSAHAHRFAHGNAKHRPCLHRQTLSPLVSPTLKFTSRSRQAPYASPDSPPCAPASPAPSCQRGQTPAPRNLVGRSAGRPVGRPTRSGARASSPRMPSQQGHCPRHSYAPIAQRAPHTPRFQTHKYSIHHDRKTTTFPLPDHQQV